MRIEVGYGLEGTLTDVAASRIIRNVMTPAFKTGDFDRGIDDGVAAIVAAARRAGSGERTGGELRRHSGSEPGSPLEFEGPDLPWYMRILLGCFIFGIIGLFTVIGVMTPGMGWFLYVFLIPFWAMFPIIIIGPKATVGLLGLYLIGYPVAKLWLGATALVRKGGRGPQEQGQRRPSAAWSSRPAGRRHRGRRRAAASPAEAAARAAAARPGAGSAHRVTCASFRRHEAAMTWRALAMGCRWRRWRSRDCATAASRGRRRSPGQVRSRGRRPPVLLPRNLARAVGAAGRHRRRVRSSAKLIRTSGSASTGSPAPTRSPPSASPTASSA